jgi:transposase
MNRKAFTTWIFNGTKYIAVPVRDKHEIMDEDGNYYGVWVKVENFRNYQREDSHLRRAVGKSGLKIIMEEA